MRALRVCHLREGNAGRGLWWGCHDLVSRQDKLEFLRAGFQGLYQTMNFFFSMLLFCLLLQHHSGRIGADSRSSKQCPLVPHTCVPVVPISSCTRAGLQIAKGGVSGKGRLCPRAQVQLAESGSISRMGFGSEAGSNSQAGS